MRLTITPVKSRCGANEKITRRLGRNNPNILLRLVSRTGIEPAKGETHLRLLRSSRDLCQQIADEFHQPAERVLLAPAAPRSSVPAPAVGLSCKVPLRSRVLPLVQGNSMRWGLDELSSTHAPHRPTRPTLVPRVIPTRVNVANAVGPDPRRFMEAHHVQRQWRSGVCDGSFRTTAAIPRGSWLMRR